MFTGQCGNRRRICADSGRRQHQALNRAHRAQHLLSGLIVCGVCGAPFAMRDAKHYGCSNFRSKGECAFGARVKRVDLERTIGDAIRREWLTDDFCRDDCAEATRKLVESRGSSDTERAKLRAALARTEASAARIVEAIAEAGHNAALIAKLGQLEHETARLKAELQEIESEKADTRAFLNEMLRLMPIMGLNIFETPKAPPPPAALAAAGLIAEPRT